MYAIWNTQIFRSQAGELFHAEWQPASMLLTVVPHLTFFVVHVASKKGDFFVTMRCTKNIWSAVLCKPQREVCHAMPYPTYFCKAIFRTT